MKRNLYGNPNGPLQKELLWYNPIDPFKGNPLRPLWIPTRGSGLDWPFGRFGYAALLATEMLGLAGRAWGLGFRIWNRIWGIFILLQVYEDYEENITKLNI